ncbi:RNA-directed DNA polymerase from mobile element jockey [Elysia marginata]|uniref:RNA-directed DNA polymerase from mobile element jockey n=1 Tax=Elysia marginata TaxID=1093978 RepID=A0AAV4EBC4_9GAST|nr:RNA-directed DNA polymerase from mobile element jockey [Elysia marginata]
MGTIFKNRNIQFGTKVKVPKAYVWSVLMYSSECWTISTEMEKHLLAVKMWFLRRIFRISWTQKKTNEEVLRLTDTDRSLLRLLRKRQMEFFGHVNKHNGLEKRETGMHSLLRFINTQKKSLSKLDIFRQTADREA